MICLAKEIFSPTTPPSQRDGARNLTFRCDGEKVCSFRKCLLILHRWFLFNLGHRCAQRENDNVLYSIVPHHLTDTIMPSSDSGNTVARQWELLNNIIPHRRPGKSASQLCRELERAGFPVSKRTVERDMHELSRLFPIKCNDLGTPHGWHWSEDRHLDMPCMENTEAISLGLMEDVLRRIMPQTFLAALEGRFTAARNKLKALSKGRHAKWKQLVRYQAPGMPFQPPHVPSDILSALQQALIEQKQMKVEYRSVSATSEKIYHLHPLSLLQHGVRSYLIATKHGERNVGQYAIHRMKSIEVTDDAVITPQGYSLDAYMTSGAAQFDPGHAFLIKARIADYLKKVLEETPLSKDQKITTRAGVHTLTATVQQSWELEFWLRSQGSALTVLQPASLRKKMIAELKENLTNYGM